MAIQTVAITGGNGTIGSAIIHKLNASDYRTVDLARGKRREKHADAYIRTNLTDPADVHGSLASTEADAVVHMGTIPSPYGASNHAVYESNVLSSMYVLEAAAAQGIDRVVLPSSINAIGSDFSDVPIPVEYLPMNEKHPVAPDDIYGIAKHAMEVTADGIGKSSDGPRTIASFRYPWVGDEDAIHKRLVEPDRTLSSDVHEAPGGKDALYTYLHLADAASAVRCAVKADFDGHETFWIVANDTTIDVPSKQIAHKQYSDADLRRPLEGFESLVSLEKARDLLDWEPEHTWRDL